MLHATPAQQFIWNLQDVLSARLPAFMINESGLNRLTETDSPRFAPWLLCHQRDSQGSRKSVPLIKADARKDTRLHAPTANYSNLVLIRS